MTGIPITFDISSILVTAFFALFGLLGKRAIASIDKNFEEVKASAKENFDSIKEEAKENKDQIEESMVILHSRITSLKTEVQSDIKDTRMDVKEVNIKLDAFKDKARDMITAVRVDLEDKIEKTNDKIEREKK